MIGYPELVLIVYYDRYGGIPHACVRPIVEARGEVQHLTGVVPEFAKVRLYTVKADGVEFLLEKEIESQHATSSEQDAP